MPAWRAAAAPLCMWNVECGIVEHRVRELCLAASLCAVVWAPGIDRGETSDHAPPHLVHPLFLRVTSETLITAEAIAIASNLYLIR